MIRETTATDHDLEQVFGRLVGDSGVVLHEAGAEEYHVGRRFHDREAMDGWQESAERTALHRELDEVAERVGQPERLSGLEPWFVSVGKRPRWNVAGIRRRRLSARRPLPVAGGLARRDVGAARALRSCCRSSC